MRLSKLIEYPIVAFISLIALMEVIMDSIANTIAELMYEKHTHLVLTFLCFIGAQAALVFGAVPTIVGGVCLGFLGGFAFWGWQRTHVNPRTETHTETIERLIPYDQWPDECYICPNEITDDMTVRGQLVIHKGNDEAQTKAVPLCESCTWTYSTLADNHDRLVGAYDCRDDPIDL